MNPPLFHSFQRPHLRLPRVLGLLIALAAAPAAHAVTGFTGPLAPGNWTTTVSGPTFGSSFDTSAAPASVRIVGGNDPAGVGCPTATAPGFLGSCQISVTVAFGADYSFHWSYLSSDVSPQYDAFGIIVDGVRIGLLANGGDTQQSGDKTVHANSSFGWYINCTDCTGGSASVTLSSISAVPEAPAAALWSMGLAALGLRAGRRRRRAALAAAAAGALGLALPAQARITRIVIDTVTSPAYSGATFGSVGTYDAISGRAFGEIDPGDTRNAIIQDIALAPRNARGKVEYITTFTVWKPTDLSKSNGVMVYQVVNRGGKVDSGGSADGYIYLENGWQGDLLSLCTTAYPCTSLASAPYTGGNEVIQVPVATNGNGSPVTGPVLGRIINASGAAARQTTVYSRPVPYKPLTLDTSQAVLTSYQSETIDGIVTGKQTIASTDWAWDNCTSWVAQMGTPNPDPTRICLRGGFDATLAYTVVFTARDPLVQGIGFAATRDVVSFFRHAAQDDFGTANPLAGGVAFTIGRGTSQSGNYLKSLIHNGFNQDEAGAMVFDGAWPHIAARQNPLNFRFALPDGAATLYEPGSEAVLWYAHYPDVKRGRPTAGILDRCTATNTCPKIFDTFGATENWDLRGSPYTVGTSADADIPLPRNVRRYYMPGTNHNGGGGGFTYTAAPSAAGGCTLPSNPNPESDTLTALLPAMVAWVRTGALPPASRYPTLSGGTLVTPTKSAMGFPTIPLYSLPATAPDGLNNPLLDYDFGPLFNYNDLSGIITIEPPIIKQKIPMLVPRVNADGNEDVALQAVPSVLHQAPLGTYLGWNITASGYRKDTICAFTGGYIPFAKTRALRLAAGDPRLSLEERYGSHAAYVAAVTAAANSAVAQRFLLQADADRLIAQAAASNVCNAAGDNGVCASAAGAADDVRSGKR